MTKSVCFYIIVFMKKYLIISTVLLIVLLSLRLYQLTNINDYTINIRNSPYPTGELVSGILKNDNVLVTKTFNKWVEIIYQDQTLYR